MLDLVGRSICRCSLRRRRRGFSWVPSSPSKPHCVSLPRRAASSPAREQLHIRVWEWGRWGAHSMHTHPHPLPPCLALWTGRHLWSQPLNFPSHFEINMPVDLQAFWYFGVLRITKMIKGKSWLIAALFLWNYIFTFGSDFINVKSGEALWVLWAIMASPAEIPPIRPTLIICRWAGPGRPFVWSFLCDSPHHTLTHAHTNPTLPSAIYRRLYTFKMQLNFCFFLHVKKVWHISEPK